MIDAQTVKKILTEWFDEFIVDIPTEWTEDGGLINVADLGSYFYGLDEDGDTISWLVGAANK